MKFLLNFYLVAILFHLISKSQVINLGENNDITIQICVLAKYMTIKYTLILPMKNLFTG